MTAASRSVRAGARGMVAAMAMSGIRSVTANLDLVEETPPRKIVERHGPEVVRRLPESGLQAVTEVLHWGYGALGGATFALLPAALRTHRAAGPVYGLAVWGAFEVGIAPLLGVEHDRRRALGRVVLALDHVLYGIVVAGQLAPEPEVSPPGR